MRIGFGVMGFQTMRRSKFIAVVAISIFALCGSAFAADLPVRPLAIPKAVQSQPGNIPVQQNQPNCSRWTDECVNCSRGADGAAPTCSNIGFACQPQAIRCLSN